MDGDIKPQKSDGRFQKGHAGFKPKGAAAIFTRDIKNGFVDAAVKHGADGKGKDGMMGFATWLLKNDIKAFASIFGRCVPLQLHADVSHTIGQVVINPVPQGQYLSEDQIRALMDPPLIEHEEAEPEPEVEFDTSNMIRLDPHNGYKR